MTTIFLLGKDNLRFVSYNYSCLRFTHSYDSIKCDELALSENCAQETLEHSPPLGALSQRVELVFEVVRESTILFTLVYPCTYVEMRYQGWMWVS